MSLALSKAKTVGLAGVRLGRHRPPRLQCRPEARVCLLSFVSRLFCPTLPCSWKLVFDLSQAPSSCSRHSAGPYPGYTEMSHEVTRRTGPFSSPRRRHELQSHCCRAVHSCSCSCSCSVDLVRSPARSGPKEIKRRVAAKALALWRFAYRRGSLMLPRCDFVPGDVGSFADGPLSPVPPGSRGYGMYSRIIPSVQPVPGQN